MSHSSDVSRRAEALLAAPAGCVLLLIAREYGLEPVDLAQPEVALFAMAMAVGQVNPWRADHERVVAAAVDQQDQLRKQAQELVEYPGIAWWWAPIDRDRQLWLPQHESFMCEHEVWELRPRSKPGPFERYVHSPRPLISTANAHGFLSSELAHILAGAGDRTLTLPSHSRTVSIRPRARVLEITSAQEWHDLVRRYPADGFHQLSDDENQPWGRAPDLMVPDWRAISFDWDGVHITPWAYLTATQVRLRSDIGWTEPWAWDGAHTVWLSWMFESEEEAPLIEAGSFEVPHYAVRALDLPELSARKLVSRPLAAVLNLRGVVRKFGATNPVQQS